MPILTHPAFGPRTSIIYITVGALMDAWTIVWYLTLGRTEGITQSTKFWLWGLFLTGLILIVIGFFLGRIGREARKAELPPTEAQDQEAAIQQTAAANQQMAMPAVVPGQAVPMTVVTQPPAPAPVPTTIPPGTQYVPGSTRR